MRSGSGGVNFINFVNAQINKSDSQRNFLIFLTPIVPQLKSNFLCFYLLDEDL
jgi:hypothetical protein